MIRFPALLLSLAGILAAAPIDLRLPTENQHLFTGEPDRFYMYVDRTFEGQTSKPWEAGSYGFVRTAIRVNDRVLLTKFHEGIDISPVKRDKAGNPLDLVSSIAAGRVAHVSPVAGRSNYGKYVVIEHFWENSSVFSLYAHLAEITCQPGDSVNAGSVLGRMGYTGAGIDRTRAHCHLELGMLLSTRYEEWHQKCGGGTNFHGVFNGMNLSGSEVSRFFIEHRANPALQFSEFIANTPVYFKVTVPSRGTPDFVARYPWIKRGSAATAVSWEISFSATGLPVAFNPSQREVAAPLVTSVRPSDVPQRYLTRGLITGEGNQATLTRSGEQLVSLITDDFPITR
jgi:murein DD-endopeptidase MepM/ murein hydrolase activator NlpD